MTLKARYTHSLVTNIVTIDVLDDFDKFSRNLVVYTFSDGSTTQWRFTPETAEKLVQVGDWVPWIDPRLTVSEGL